MKLFLISQTTNDCYDTYDSAVVAASDAEAARKIHPNGETICDWSDYSSSWVCSPDEVIVKYIGEAAEEIQQGVICASFNAG